MSIIKSGTTSTTAYIVEGNTNGDLVLQTNGTTTAVTIDTSQNVGIGTSSPSAKLQVGMPSSGSGVIFRHTGSTNNPGLFISVDESTKHIALTASGSSVAGQLLQLGAEGTAGVLNIGASNVGLGVTPKNNTLGKSLQNGQASAWVSETGSNRFWLGSNWYYDGGDKYINNGHATLYSQQSGQHQWLNSASGTAGAAISFTQALTLNTSGNLVLQGGSTGANGIGVTFPASQSASSDANCLDDYEEGTFTPTVLVDSGTPTYQYQQGYYTKIGRQVFGGGIIGITNSDTLGGVIRISVPFTISAQNYGYTGGTVSDGSGFTFPISNGFYNVYLQANPGDSHLTYVGLGGTATTVSYTTSGVSPSWYFRYMFSYYT